MKKFIVKESKKDIKITNLENEKSILSNSLEIEQQNQKEKVRKKGHKESKIIKAGSNNFLDNQDKFEYDLRFIEDNQGYLINEKNHFKTRFGKSIQDNELAFIEKSGHKISMCFLSRKEKVRKTSRRNTIISSKKSSKVKYENAEDGIDFEYELTQTGIKENIIVKQVQDEYCYQFDLNIGSLKPKYDEKYRTLELQENDKTIYRLKSPYMFDSAGELSNDCAYEIEEKESGILSVTLKADKNWINEPNRKFPVTIDPTIEVINNTIFEIKQFVNGNESTLSNNHIKIGSEGPYPRRAFYSLLFRINSEIIKSNCPSFSKIMMKLFLAEIGKSLSEDIEFVLANGENELKRYHKSDFKNEVNFDITNLVENSTDYLDLSLYISDDPNFSTDSEETSLITKNAVISRIYFNTISFYSPFDENENLSPQLLITYYNKEIARKNAPTKDYSLGLSGTTSVNILDRSFKHRHYDASITQNSLTIDVSHIFDSYENITECYLGKRWKTNFHQALVKNKDFNQILDSKEVSYYDGDGNVHLLHEQWYYTDNNIKHYVNREKIYLDSDQKIKYKADENNIYEVKFEVKNDEGLTYLSGMNVNSYPIIKQSKKKYFARFGFGKREIDISGNNHLQFFYYSLKTGEKVYVKPLDVSKCENGYFESRNGNALCIDEEYNSVITESNESTYQFSYQFTSFTGEQDGYSYHMENRTDGEIIVEEIVEEQEQLQDIYENEDIVNVNYQIENIKLHLDDLKYAQKSTLNAYYALLSQYIGTVQIYASQNKMEEYEKILNDIQNELTVIQKTFYNDIGNECLKAVANKKLRDHENKEIVQHFSINEDTLKCNINTDFNLEKEASSVLNKYNYLYQRKSNIDTLSSYFANTQKKYQKLSKIIQDINLKASLKNATVQIEKYDREIGKNFRNITEYNNQLENLLKQKQALVENQKREVNDFIFDKDGNTLGFDGYGRLILIQDKYENKIQIEFGYEDENKDKMLSIYSDSQTIKFNYDKETGLLSSMIDAQGRKTKYNYEGEHLSSIIYPNKNKTSFVYDNGFKVISPLLDSINIVSNDNGTMSVRTYCLEGEMTKDTILTGNELIKNLTDELYIFDETYQKTIIRDKKKSNDNELEEIEDDNVYYFDAIRRVIETHSENTKSVCFFENNKLKSEVAFQKDEAKSLLEHLTIYDGPHTYQIQLDKFQTVEENKLPISNMLGLYLETLTGNVDNDSIHSFKVRVTVHTTNKDGTLKSEVFEQEYHEIKLQTLVLPICIDRNLSYKVDIEIESLSEDFNSGTYFNAVDLIKLEEGKIYSYDEKDRLIKEQDGYTTICYEDYNEDDVPLTKIESNIYGEKVTTHYSYNSNQQLTLIEDSKQNVEEYYYDEKGNCIEKRSYNKKDASLMKVEKQTFDEQGRPLSTLGSIQNDKGEYPKEEVTYLPKTDITSKVRQLNGASTCYQYDANTGDLLSISSSASGINNSTSFTYNYGLLTSMSHHGMKVEYVYDGRGRKLRTTLNGEDVIWNEYNDDYDSNNDYDYHYSERIKNGSKVTSTTIEGFYTATYQNEKGQTLYSDYSSNDSFGSTNYKYEEEKLIEISSSFTYRETNETYQESLYNAYDEFDELVKQEKKINDVSKVVLENHYDDDHRFIKSSDVILSESEYRLNTVNEYDSEHKLKSVKLREGIIGEEDEECFLTVSKTDLDYDVLGRVTHQNIEAKNVNICYEYSYLQQDENTLNLIAEDITKIRIKNGSNTTYLTETNAYQYDVSGNIISIDTDENKTRYQYDKLNRLAREDNPLINKTIVYKYDKAGNIILKKTYAYSLDDHLFSPEVKEYIYDCEKGRDRLISYDGKVIEYNENCIGGKMGYPTTYKDDEFEWNNQGQLTYILNQNMDEIEYFYDNNGIRRKKIVNGEETSFITNGTQILSMKQGNLTLIFRYVLNKLVGFNYNSGSSSKEYLYQRNIQGDIIGIFDDDGNQVGGYAYDAYGNHLISLDIDGIASTNPFRYRGYFFDNETKLYYLNARYYDPEIRRFISPDVLSILDETKGQINGLNLYMYCADNPIMNVDPSGYAWWNWLISIGQIIVGTILVATGVGAGIGATLIVGGIIGIGMQFLSPAIAQIIGGLGSIANGWGALSSAISLFSFGTIGIVLGIVLGAVSIATMAFGVNDVVAGATGTNYIQKWTGMSNTAYAWTNFGLNLASGLGQFATPYIKQYASNRILNSIVKNPSKISKYNLQKIQKYGRHATQWNEGVLKKGNHQGKGYTLTNKINSSNGYIQWHPGSRWHFNSLPYWKVTSGLYGTWRGLYLF